MDGDARKEVPDAMVSGDARREVPGALVSGDARRELPDAMASSELVRSTYDRVGGLIVRRDRRLMSMGPSVRKSVLEHTSRMVVTIAPMDYAAEIYE